MGTRLVRVTHPFHPLSGRQLRCVGERHTRYGTRLLLHVDEDHVCSVPRQWTDVVALDPEVVIGGGRLLFRVADLLDLADLVLRLVAQEQRASHRKENDAACVRPILPQTAPEAFPDGSHWTASATRGDANVLDSGIECGIIDVTQALESPCRNEAIARTQRPRPSSRRAR